MSGRADDSMVSVVIPTYNRCELLAETLCQLTRQRLPADRFDVVVSDDGSSDQTKAVVDAFADRLRLRYHFQEDLGNRASVARNAGARLARGPVLVFLDTGALPGPDYLRHHLAGVGDPAARRAVLGYAYGFNPLGIVPGLAEALTRMPPEDLPAYYRDEPAFLDVRHEALSRVQFDLSRMAIPWTLLFTINCSIRTDDFWAVGGFGDELVGWGAEDLEFGLRAVRDGVRLVFSQDAWVVESPHERTTAGNLAMFQTNLHQFLELHPGPAVEIGPSLVPTDDVLHWDEEYRAVLSTADRVRHRSVIAEINASLAGLPDHARVAVIGSGAVLPASMPPGVLIDFDQWLLDQALAGSGGRHTGRHAIGLHTRLPDQSVDLVVVTSRLAELWPRWGKEILAEAHRIGGAVRSWRLQ